MVATHLKQFIATFSLKLGHLVDSEHHSLDRRDGALWHLVYCKGKFHDGNCYCLYGVAFFLKNKIELI